MTLVSFPGEPRPDVARHAAHRGPNGAAGEPGGARLAEQRRRAPRVAQVGSRLLTRRPGGGGYGVHV